MPKKIGGATLVHEDEIDHDSHPWALEVRGKGWTEWTTMILAPREDHAELKSGQARLKKAGYETRIRKTTTET